MTPGNALYQLFKTVYGRPDPGDAGTIRVNRQFSVFPLVSTTAQTRTLAQPAKEGLIVTVEFDTDNGDITLTVTGGYNADGDTSLTLADPGDFVTFISIKVGSSYYWRVLSFEGVNVAVEDLSVDQLTLNELTLALSDGMTPGSGWVAGITTPNVYSIVRTGGIVKTEIFIDMIGLNGTSAADDIIGDDGAVDNCHFGRITAALNGTLVGGKVSCFETPAGGNIDVDFWSGIEATGTNDEDIKTELTGEIKHIDHGNWAAGEEAVLTTVPAADMYLYLAAGVNTDADFSAGKFLIELWGTI